MDKIVNNIANWINSTDKRIVIGMSGHGAAGKTTFAHKLLHVLDNVNYMNTDPYIVSSHVRKNTIIEYTYQNEVHQYKMTACHPINNEIPRYYSKPNWKGYWSFPLLDPMNNTIEITCTEKNF